VQPSRAGYVNAVQVFPFTEGALYQVYAAPGQVTDIALQEGEQLVGSGPVAAGDTVRWIIGDTESGPANAKRVHILVKPTRPDIVTNLVINTDRRTYHMELRSTERTYMASVSWIYPQDQLIALHRQNAAAETADQQRLNAISVDLDAIRQIVDRIAVTQEQTTRNVDKFAADLERITRNIDQLTAGQERMTREISSFSDRLLDACVPVVVGLILPVSALPASHS
jgi:P-type conjugative transfer protein TrbG